ncbi:MAG: hypothetical protein ACKN89_09685 [Cyanobium sp.]|jgi:hypothetical protein
MPHPANGRRTWATSNGVKRGQDESSRLRAGADGVSPHSRRQDPHPQLRELEAARVRVQSQEIEQMAQWYRQWHRQWDGTS